MNQRYWKLAITAGSTLVVGFAALAACSSDEAGTGADVTIDGGSLEASTGAACAPGARTCKDDATVVVCGADGKSLSEQACGVGERCSGGACVSTTSPNFCQDAKSALRRKADGTLEVVSCPEGTTCQGAGVCKGAFIVGGATCSDLFNLAKSVDGLTEVLEACGAGQLCVSTGDSGGIPTAACKVPECFPTSPNVAFCGNPKVATADQDKSITKCVETPEGYKYTTTLCTTGTCSPGAAGASGGDDVDDDRAAVSARCSVACIDGTSRCTTGGITTCAGGKWGAPVACGASKTCFPSRTNPSKAVCGDAACARSKGACASNTSIRTCDATGNLGTAVACATGRCADDTLGGGICFAECTAGEERCTSANGNGTSFQTCVNGSWSSTATQCPSNARCIDATSAAGLHTKLCGAECTPGQTKCTSADGGAGNSSLRTCDATGKWGAATECAIGTCQTDDGVGACVAECTPNAVTCTGGTTGVAGTPFSGTSEFRTCSAKGILGTTSTACGAGTLCRTRNGTAILPAGSTNPCIACVGGAITGGNEDGLVDSRCSSADGSGIGSAGSQVCSATNTWAGAGVTSCSGNGCQAPETRSGPAVAACRRNNRGDYRTETYYASRRRHSCAGSNGGGVPTVCGAVPDCCSTQCERPVPAHPATCNAVGAP